MDRRRLIGGLGAGLSAGLTFGPSLALADAGDLKAAAAKAWLYVLPLIEMAAARRRMTDPNRPGQHANLDSFSHHEDLVGPEDRGITTPNNDTLYSNAFIDLSSGPAELIFPDIGARYASVAVMDMYTNNNVVLGARTPGGPVGRWRLVGPGHPIEGPRDLPIATPHAWVLARILVDGAADLPEARRVQKRFKLSAPKVARPPALATRDASWSAYFRSAAALLKSDPPASTAGLSAFERVRSAGRSRDFDPTGYSPEDAAAIATGAAQALNLVQSHGGPPNYIQGWTYPRNNLGQFGDDFIFRAVVAVTGLGALPQSEAMYLRPEGDNGKSVFSGDGLYRLSLTDPLPVDGFWSLTMYEATADGQFFLTPNPINRYAIGDRTAGLKRGPGGEIDLWIGRADPGGERTSNWLPAPDKGEFTCSMRAYLPRAALREGRYRLPPILHI